MSLYNLHIATRETDPIPAVRAGVFGRLHPCVGPGGFEMLILDGRCDWMQTPNHECHPAFFLSADGFGVGFS